ncbi:MULTISPECIES: hypothetical protein [Bacillaceae]|uniref:hypothetical protein n=1 Tax=Bacillaceae TaxID=186817 RepID=UPI0029656EC7|nr:hypothetical protein [Bacillus infantis]MDW2876412.1 hypothetical protein [Bacillus infantis]
MKKKAIKLATSTAIAATAFVAAAPANQADAAVNVEALVKDAENAAGALKWAISVEGTADGANAPWALYNLTKDATTKAKAAVAKTSGKDKVLYEARLQAADVQISRAMAYIDGITAGKKIEAGTAALKAAIASKDLDKVEANYHALTKEVRKQAELLYRVYGQSTRALILDQTKKPAEDAVKSVQVDVTVHMHLADAAAAVKAGDYKKAGEHVEKANAWMNQVSATFKDQLTKDRNDVVASLPLAPVSVSRVNNTTVTVNFNKAVDAVSIAHFAFDNGLTVTDAKLSSDAKTVTLTTTTQAAGKTYTLSYKGAKTSVAFSTPANPADNSLVIDNNSEVYLKADGSRVFTATFKNADNSAYRGVVNLTTTGDVAIVAVNGVNVTARTTATAVPNADGKVTVKIAKSAGATASDAVGTLTFENETTGKEVKTGKTHFVTEASNTSTATGSTEVTVNYVDKAGKFFIGTVASGSPQWYSYDTNDTVLDNGTPVSLADFEAALAEGNKVRVNYQNNGGSSKISDFNVIFKKTLSDLTVTNPNRDTTAADPFRVAPDEQFVLAGKGQAGYTAHIYRYDGTNYVLHSSTPVDGAGNYSTQVNLDKNALNQFGVLQLPTGVQAPGTTSSVSEVVYVKEGAFEVTTVTSTNLVNVGAQVSFTFTTGDTATFENGDTLTFVDNQGVEATYTVGTATADTKVVTGTNKTNRVTVTLGQPVYSNLSAVNNSFNHAGPVYLKSVNGVNNQDNLLAKIPSLIRVQ